MNTTAGLNSIKNISNSDGRQIADKLFEKISSEIWEVILQQFDGLKTTQTLPTTMPEFGGLAAIAKNDFFIPTSSAPLIRIPGYPANYNSDKCRTLDYFEDHFHQCEKPGTVVLFGTFVAILGLSAIFGNCLLPFVLWQYRDMRTKHNYIKVSLAVNDMIVGFILLFSVLPNVVWFRNSSENEVVQEMLHTFNSPTAIVAGSSLIISLQGSLLHLMFLSADRFVAIRWPMWHRHRQTSTVLWTLLGIWLVTILGSAITGAIPQYFNYMYNPQVFMFTLGYAGSNVESRAHGLLHFGLALFLPYVVTIILTMLTGAAAFRGLKSFSTMNESQRPSISENGRTELPHVKYAAGFIRPKKGLMRQDTIRITGDTKKPEFAVVQTIIIMVVAFALAWSLFFVIFFISYNNEPKNERATSVVYMVSFYSGLSNSVANVVIYSVRDDRFRSAVASTFRHKNMSSYHNSSYGSK